LQLLGFEVDVANSVHFSNHTGYEQGWEGDVLKGEQLRAVLDGLERNNLLQDIHHVLTGYIGSESFLEAILDVLRAVRKCSTIRYVCDPVLGDNGEFYVPQNLVKVYKEKLIPMADVLTPNQFEVEQLTGIKIDSLEKAKAACTALHALGPSLVFVTSCILSFGDAGAPKSPSKDGTISILASQVEDESTELWKIDCPVIPGRYTGTGDLCAALLLAHTARLPGNLALAMERVINTMYAVIERTYQASGDTIKSRELKLIQSRHAIENPTTRFKAVRLV
jgi:pyridoxine kinase